MTTRISFLVCALLAFGLLFAPLVSHACCPSDGNGHPARVGLGQRYPAATNLSTSPSWRVYQFERDAVRYIQINDAASNVRGGAGYVDGVVWALPIGTNPERISVVPPPAGTNSTLLFQSEEIQVRVYTGPSGEVWSITPAD